VKQLDNNTAGSNEKDVIKRIRLLHWNYRHVFIYKSTYNALVNEV